MDQIHRTRIKICGMTDPESASVAIAAGADALGMVFYAPSPRHVELVRAAEIARVAHPFVTLVGLFVDADPKQVEETLEQVPLGLLQFHGEESAEFCQSFGLPYIKALRVGQKTEAAESLSELAEAAEAYCSAQALLLDTYKKGVPGGTGETFNWDLIPALPQHIILAGGLNAENVEKAISSVKPYAVDTSGGVESAPGVKDPDRIRAFIQQVRQADLNSHA